MNAPTPASNVLTGAPLPPNVTVVDHPMIQHKLTLMRRSRTPANEFRLLLREISMLLAYEVTRDMPTELIEIETPLATMQAPVVAGKKLCLVSVLRAGGGILEGMLEILPAARVGHVGLYRDPVSLAAVEYYLKLPRDISSRTAIVLDPMLATGNSAVAAVSEIKAAGCQSIKFVCLLAAPEGVQAMYEAHPDVPIFAAAVDSHLNDHGYIVPGIGDAGDRIFGTK
ncbi:Uracil phosphoribosyltransferase [Starkeya nomas]|uniref:Uracil phosphoribosyltransferase n=2 Tax=Xanthobacteraceae TaxID=335928 RepID=A0A5S9NB90_9HYPH|nr:MULTISPECIES: uracil phosphoribosyltransferase [Xanthobacteraceae]TSJ64701.1 uracil phosphoribosyltransferase [Ancylobacter moscoviensis]CAA0086391.1 Uracil phosphoribosyltransferase [Starkeya nomas]